MFVREYMEYVQCVTTLITGSLFIYNVKSLRSDTWKKQKLHTIILIVAIEITLIAQIVSVFKFAIPDHTDIQDYYYIKQNLSILINFVLQDLMFGYVWVIYGTPDDTFQLYNEIETSNFSIF